MASPLSIKEYLDRDERKDLLRLLTAGSVDDGKSTLIGRLLFDSKKLYEDQLAALERDSRREGNAGEGHIDYALLLDGLKAEREQGITIDVAYRYFSTNRRKFIIADTPGHEQYTRNMITGGSTAQLAIILIDARTGVITQTRRHTFLCALLGIKHIALAVNKMDLVDYDRAVYDRIVADYREFLHQLEASGEALQVPQVVPFPLSALEGDNVVERSARMPWYEGTSLLEHLESVNVGQREGNEPLRYPVQYVLRPNRDFRGFCGKVAAGTVRPGDELLALPSGKRAHVTRIVTYEGDLPEAFPPQSVTLCLDKEIDISRGDMLVRAEEAPHVGRSFEAMLVWMDEEAMDADKSFYLKQTTHTTRCHVEGITYRTDVNTLAHTPAKTLALNEIARVTLTTAKALFFDSYSACKATGAFILIDPLTNNTSAVGMIIAPAEGHAASADEALPVVDLTQLGITSPEARDAVRRALAALSRQGIEVEIKD